MIDADIMFGFLKHRQKHATSSNEDYQAEFRRRTNALSEKFAVEDTPYDELLDAMDAVEDEMNRNGGVNWVEGNYDRYLEVIGEHLATAPQFSSQELKKIKWALDEIAICGDELERDGESGRALDEPIDYLIARAVDWCRTHEPAKREDT